MASLSQGGTASAQCGLFTYKSFPVIFEPPCNFISAASILRLCEAVKVQFSDPEIIVGTEIRRAKAIFK